MTIIGIGNSSIDAVLIAAQLIWFGVTPFLEMDSEAADFITFLNFFLRSFLKKTKNFKFFCANSISKIFRRPPRRRNVAREGDDREHYFRYGEARTGNEKRKTIFVVS